MRVPIPEGLKQAIMLFFTTTLQPLCYVVNLPAQDSAPTLVSALRSTFFSCPNNSIGPASTPTAATAAAAAAHAAAPAPAASTTPSPAPAPVHDPVAVITIVSQFVHVPDYTSTQNCSSSLTPSCSISVTPSVPPNPPFTPPVTFTISTQELNIPGICDYASHI